MIVLLSEVKLKDGVRVQIGTTSLQNLTSDPAKSNPVDLVYSSESGLITITPLRPLVGEEPQAVWIGNTVSVRMVPPKPAPQAVKK